MLPSLGLLSMGRGGRRLVVRSQQPDVEKKKEVSSFDMPKRIAVEAIDEGRRVERMFSNLNEVSLKHEPGKLPHSL